MPPPISWPFMVNLKLLFPLLNYPIFENPLIPIPELKPEKFLASPSKSIPPESYNFFFSGFVNTSCASQISLNFFEAYSC